MAAKCGGRGAALAAGVPGELLVAFALPRSASTHVLVRDRLPLVCMMGETLAPNAMTQVRTHLAPVVESP